MARTDNYLLSRDRAAAYFLGFDQKKLIKDWHLDADESWLNMDFLGRPYRVCRKTGKVFRQWDGRESSYDETLSIFDLLCHEGANKSIGGSFAPVNSLKGRPVSVGVGTDFHAALAERFNRDTERFCRACVRLGGTAVDIGDIGYRFPVFQDLSVILKFYHSDEDFPASLTLLWDENMLHFVFYETVFYIAGFLLGSIEEEMGS